MTTEQLNATWSRKGNELTVAEAQSLTMAFLGEVRARRSRTSFGLAAAATAFLALGGLSIAAIVTQDDLKAKHAWMFAAMNAVLWTGWGFALTRHLSEKRAPAAAGKPVWEALQQGLEQRLSYMSHLRTIALGLMLTTPHVAFSLHQMVETGRIAPADVPLRIVFALAAYAIAFACLGADYFGRSTQEVEHLRRLLADCEPMT